jgi:hypothetical protein
MLTGRDLVKLELVILGLDGRRPARQRRTTGDLAAQVRALLHSAMVATAIADRLNIPDRRCKELIRLTGAKNGTTKPHGQRVVRAAQGFGPVAGQLDLPRALPADTSAA